MPNLKRFLERVGIRPTDLALYRRALTHLSSAPSPEESYERLEFLGDSVIEMVISDFLYRKFPVKEEGELSRIRALVVSRETLGAKAQEIGLERFLRVETARVREGEPTEFSILADCFEALVGAAFTDRGYRHARSFVLRHLKDECMSLRDLSGPIDYKSQLQELWQQRYKETPEYTVVRESGPDHDKVFSIEARYEGRLLGRGKGSSKKRAEQEAAQAALEREARKKRRRKRR